MSPSLNPRLLLHQILQGISSWLWQGILAYRWSLMIGLGSLLLWQAMGVWGWLPITVPTPWQVALAFGRWHEVLWFHAQATGMAALVGYAASCGLALGLGMLAVFVPPTEGILYNLAVIVYSVPLIALTPLLVIWLGTGSSVRVVIAAIASFFPIMVGAIQGFKAPDAGSQELFQLLSADRWQVFCHLQWPAALPYLFAGLKAAAASAVLGAIISEWTGADRGLGMMMTFALFSFDVPQVWLTMLTSAAMAVGSFAVVALAEQVCVSWRQP